MIGLLREVIVWNIYNQLENMNVLMCKFLLLIY